MSDTSPNLSLTLPRLGEFKDSWHTPTNNNFLKIDAAIGSWLESTSIADEIRAARFATASLAEFLAMSHNTDGTLLPVPEVKNARNSILYGYTHDSDETMQLMKLSKKRDLETWKARAAANTLRDAIAYPQSFNFNRILNGAKDANGYPVWHGYTGTKFQIDGRTTPVIFSIDGKIARVRTLMEKEITGAPGATLFVYALYQDDGVVTVNTPEAAPTGAITTDDGGYYTVHQDANVVFTSPTTDVKAGDILRYKAQIDPLPSAPLALQGDYYIDVIAPGATPNANAVQIRGLFPTTEPVANIPYEIRDPLGIVLGFDAVETPAAGKVYIGEATLNGSATAIVPRPRHFGDTFIGEWRQVTVVSSPGTFEEEWEHNLGSDKLEVTVQASTVNDGSAWVETLSIAKINNTLDTVNPALVLTATPALTASIPAGVTTAVNTTPPDAHIHNVNSGTAISIGGSVGVAGTPDVSLSGAVVPYSAVAVKYTRNRVSVKNVVPYSLFQDYADDSQSVGYVRVIITKKG